MTGVDAATDTDEPTGTDPAAATPARRRAPAAWAAPEFRRLTVAWVFTNLGDSALYLMAAVWVKELTGSDVAAAFVFISLGLPALAGPFLGMLADRVSRKGLLIATNFGLVPIVLSMCLVTDPDRVWIVYAAIFAYSAAGYLTGAAQSGILRSLLRDDQLASGNGMLSTIDNGLRLVSPLIGTALYVWIGPFAVVGLTAACFAVTGVILLGLRVDDSRPAATAERRGYWTELVAGFVHLFRAPGLGVVTIAVAIAFGATGLLNVIVFPALDRIGVDPATIGVLVPLQGAGAVLGGVLSATIVTRFGEGRAAALGLLLLAIGIVPVVGSSILLVGAGMVVMGIGIPITVVAFATLRQRMTPHDLQGRAAAAGNVAVNLPQTLASVVGASVLAIVDYRWLVAITIGAVLVSAIVAFRARIESSVQASSP